MSTQGIQVTWETEDTPSSSLSWGHPGSPQGPPERRQEGQSQSLEDTALLALELEEGTGLSWASGAGGGDWTLPGPRGLEEGTGLSLGLET